MKSERHNFYRLSWEENACLLWSLYCFLGPKYNITKAFVFEGDRDVNQNMVLHIIDINAILFTDDIHMKVALNFDSIFLVYIVVPTGDNLGTWVYKCVGIKWLFIEINQLYNKTRTKISITPNEKYTYFIIYDWLWICLYGGIYLHFEVH